MTFCSEAFICACFLPVGCAGKTFDASFISFAAVLGFAQRSGRIRSAERAEAHLEQTASSTFFQPEKADNGRI
jgi:hypothetical protein